MPERGGGRRVTIVTYMFSSRRGFAASVATVSLAAACLLPTAAFAEAPSVDAYGGQALVLGKPRPPASRGGSHRHGSAVSTRSTPDKSGYSNPQASSETTTQPPTSGTAGTTPSPAPHSRGAKKHASAGRARTTTDRAPSTPVTGSKAATVAVLARETQPVGISGSDLALLITIAFGLVLSGGLVRALSRRPG